MEVLICIAYSVLFIFLIHKLKFFENDFISKKILSLLFIIKIASAFAITLIYTYYYKDNFESDIFKYFSDGKVIYSSLHNSPTDFLRLITGIGSDSPHLEQYYKLTNFWFKQHDYNLLNDNRTIIRFNAISMIFSFGYLSVHNVFMAFLSFLGLTAIYKTFSKYVENKLLLTIAIYLIPSVLIWTSGVLKEGLVMFSLGFVIYYFDKLTFQNFKVSYFILLLLFAFLLFITKFYILLAIIPGMLSILVSKILKNTNKILIFILVHLLVLTIFFNFHKMVRDYNLPLLISTKQVDFINMLKYDSHAGSQIQIPYIEPSLLGFVKNIPNALFNSFFRPHIFEIKSFMYIIPSIENFLILFFILLIFFKTKKIKQENIYWILFCISFVLILFTLCGLTTPVLGALVRYRTPALPFLFIIFITFIDFNNISFLKKLKWKK